MSFDSVLNVIIPWVIGIGAVYLLYKPLAPMFSGLSGWIGKIFKGKEEDLGDYVSYPANLEFE